MKTENIYLAVDYGASKSLMMIAEKDFQGKLHVLGMEEEKTLDMMSPNHIFGSQLLRCVNRCENVERFAECYKGYSCQSLRSNNKLQIKKNVDGRMIDQYLLSEMDAMCNAEAETISEQIPLAVRALKYYVDEEEVQKSPLGRTCSVLRADYMCVSAKRVFAAKEELSNDIVKFVTAPLAMADNLLTERERNNGCVLIDFGAHNTTVVVCYFGKVQHIAVIPLGGRNVTLDIANYLGIPEDDAEHYKITYGNANTDEASTEHKVINVNGKDLEFSMDGLAQVVAARENEILEYVWRELRQLNCFDKIADGIIITGGASQMRGLEELIAKRQIKVKQLNLDQYLDIVSTAYKNPKYAHIIALLLEAKENAAVFKKPVEPIYTPPVVETPEVPETPEQNPHVEPVNTHESENQGGKKRRDLFGNLKSTFGTLFGETENE